MTQDALGPPGEPRAVIACTLAGVRANFVVWRAAALGRAVGLPIAPESDNRNEIPLHLLSDLIAMGLPGGKWVVRVAQPRELRPAVRIGTVPGDIWAMIGEAVRREQDTRRIEAAGPIRRTKVTPLRP